MEYTSEYVQPDADEAEDQDEAEDEDETDPPPSQQNKSTVHDPGSMIIIISIYP